MALSFFLILFSIISVSRGWSADYKNQGAATTAEIAAYLSNRGCLQGPPQSTERKSYHAVHAVYTNLSSRFWLLHTHISRRERGEKEEEGETKVAPPRDPP